MKRSKNPLAVCPSCNQAKRRSEMKSSMKVLEHLERQNNKHYKELGLDSLSYASFINADFEWACDECLEKKKAILAHPSLQETPHQPHLAYADLSASCYNCGKEFIFKKEEKAAWYEAYKLPIHEVPNDCFECRKARRKQRQENKIVSEILQKPLAEIKPDELEMLIDIYLRWNKLDKAKYYQSILHKMRKARK